MRVLGIIPARKGSKTIKNKNTVPLCGKPLIVYTFESAKSSCLDRIVVSTDCPVVKLLARDCGLEVIDRPESLAQDDMPMLPVLQHALSVSGEAFDAVCLLQPTCPLRRAEDIDGAIETMERQQATSVISYVDVGANHPARMVKLDSVGRPHMFCGDNARRWANKQTLPPIYLRSGDIYLTRAEVLSNGDLVGDKPRAYVIPPERHLNIDCQWDLEWAEFLMRDRKPMHSVTWSAVTA